jgi:hypothetical protein
MAYDNARVVLWNMTIVATTVWPLAMYTPAPCLHTTEESAIHTVVEVALPPTRAWGVASSRPTLLPTTVTLVAPVNAAFDREIELVVGAFTVNTATTVPTAVCTVDVARKLKDSEPLERALNALSDTQCVASAALSPNDALAEYEEIPE